VIRINVVDSEKSQGDWIADIGVQIFFFSILFINLLSLDSDLGGLVLRMYMVSDSK